MRGVAGGALLGVPLLYTQEVWSHGASLNPTVIMFFLGLTFCLNIVLSHYVGFARGKTQHPVEEAIIGTGLSVLLALLLLLLLDRIPTGLDLRGQLGIIGLTAVPIGLGFAVGSALAPQEGGEGAQQMTGALGDLAAAAAGATFLALNIAPTEEPILLASELGWGRLSALVVASVVLPYLIVFYAEFGGVERRHASDGASQGPLTETFLAYIVAFALSALLLAIFGRLENVDAVALSEIVVLAFPASLGAALGRMLI